MRFIVYVSSAVECFEKSDLVRLLETSRRNNVPAGITGLLLYKDGNFMQVLEGEDDAVASVHRRILEDSRHRGILTLLEGPLTERQFPGWSMGFHDLRSAEPSQIPGYSEFLNVPLTGAEFSAEPTRAQKLLMSFKKNM